MVVVFDSYSHVYTKMSRHTPWTIDPLFAHAQTRFQMRDAKTHKHIDLDLAEVSGNQVQTTIRWTLVGTTCLLVNKVMLTLTRFIVLDFME